MKTTICYFSGTGNSRHAADRLAEALAPAGLEPVVGLLASERPVVDADTVGIVFPIHAFTLPHVVEDFLERVEMPNATYVFALSTRECSGRVALRMDRLLRRRGRRLDSFYGVRGPQSYIAVFPAATADHAEAMDRKLDVVVPTIVDAVGRRSQTIPKDGLVLGIVAGTLLRLMTWIYRRTDSYHLADRFYSDDRCTGCGTCETVCLSGRIRIEESTPVWDRAPACLQCFACLHYCPEQAVQIRSSRTERTGRFHFPGIGPKIIAEQKSPAAGG